MTSSGRRNFPQPDATSGLRLIRLQSHGRVAPRRPFAVLDVETTGLNTASDRIIEIAVVRCSPSGEKISEWSSLVDPGRDPGPTHIHGITAADLVGAPKFAEISSELRRHLDGAIFTAHNLPFDAAFVAHEFAQAGAPPLDGLGLCTLDLVRVARPDRRKHSLAVCADELGIPHPDAHRALGDALVTAEMLRILLRDIPSGFLPWPRRRLRLA